jgi:FSR family fosmidomycin resistance protein-like MFS transporter
MTASAPSYVRLAADPPPFAILTADRSGRDTRHARGTEPPGRAAPHALVSPAVGRACRPVVFPGLSTFLSRYVEQRLGGSRAAGTAALFVLSSAARWARCWGRAGGAVGPRVGTAGGTALAPLAVLPVLDWMLLRTLREPALAHPAFTTELGVSRQQPSTRRP